MPPPPDGIRTHDRTTRADVDLHLTQRGHGDRQRTKVNNYKYKAWLLNNDTGTYPHVFIAVNQTKCVTKFSLTEAQFGA
jgi:hypothetical protein